MKILFLTKYFYPHVGGVEKHVFEVSKKLINKKNQVTVLTYKHEDSLKTKEKLKGIEIVRFLYPQVKYFGLLYIWYWIIINRKFFLKNDIIHCHDVMVWYLPLRLVYPRKKVFLTVHGWEGVYPIPFKNIILKRISVAIATASLGIGEYINKWYGVKTNTVSYGAIALPEKTNFQKNKKELVYLGRLDKDVGILKFLKWVKKNKSFKVIFCGDGDARAFCEKEGKVLGYVEPTKYLKKAYICVPSGYLGALEAMSYKCKIKVFWNNPVREDIWKLTPFYKFIINQDVEGAYNWVKVQTWANLVSDYLELWNL